MADASQSPAAVKKIPDSLYELCLTKVVNHLHKSKCDKNDFHALPDSILMDVYYKVSQLFQALDKNIVWVGRDTVIVENLLRIHVSDNGDYLERPALCLWVVGKVLRVVLWAWVSLSLFAVVSWLLEHVTALLPTFTAAGTRLA